MTDYTTKTDGIYYYSFFEHASLICATSCRGVDLGFQNNSVLRLKENRRRFLDKLGIDYTKLILPQQIHKAGVVLVKEADKGKGALDYESSIPLADSLMTNQKYLPLGILTADCLPIFLYAPDTHSIALIHAGWRGTAAGVAQNTVKAVCKEFNSHPSKLLVGFGPGIRRCHYEVKGKLQNYFPGQLKSSEGRFYLDLVELNIKQFLEMGIKPEHIFDSQLCTVCKTEDFFSYRREGPGVGRMLSVVMLR